MSLLKLPNEIILLIAQEVQLQQDLSSLVQVNHRLYTLLTHVLYQYNISHDRGRGILLAAQHGSLSAVQQFVKAECQYPFYPSHVYHDPWASRRLMRPRRSIHPISYAAQHGHADIVKYLIRQGSDLNFKDFDHKTPMHLAARNGFLSVLKVLEEEGADLASFRHNGVRTPLIICDSPIQEAAHSGHKDVVEYLLAHSGCSRDDANSALPAAASSGNIDLVSLLLQHGADINFQNKALGYNHGTRDYRPPDHGPTALISAADFGRVAMVQFLIDNGADINYKRRVKNDEQTALTEAMSSEHKEIVKLLLNCGANIFNGPINMAIARNMKEMLELFLPKVEQRDKLEVKEDFLVMAAAAGALDAVKLLSDKGFNEEAALMEAIQYKHVDIVDFLLRKGTNPDVPSLPHRNAVHDALRGRNKAIIGLLLQYGAHIRPESLRAFTTQPCARPG